MGGNQSGGVSPHPTNGVFFHAAADIEDWEEGRKRGIVKNEQEKKRGGGAGGPVMRDERFHPV